MKKSTKKLKATKSNENSLENWSKIIHQMGQENISKRRAARETFREIMEDHELSTNAVNLIYIVLERNSLMTRYMPMGSGRNAEHAKIAAKRILEIDEILEDLVK